MSERFKLDLRGIINLAANHLYSTPDVFIRELIQNAVDAVSARRRLGQDFAGQVCIELTPGRSDQPATLCVSDNGIGLTESEVHEFLSTVGGSSKREATHAELTEQVERERGDFLGQFGIGLLSCFMVSDEIVAVTRSAREPAAPAMEWRGRADGSYTVRPIEGGGLQFGTRVFLRAKEFSEEYFDRERLLDLARNYCQMLSTPIAFTSGGDAVPINRTPPWDMAATDLQALSDFCQEQLGIKALDIFPIEAPAGGVRGYGFIREDRTPQPVPIHRLYARGMFVSEQVHGLLPNWATFVGCVLDSDGLSLTASREAVQYGDILEATREQIGGAIRNRLTWLMRHDNTRFAAIMAVHDTEIRHLAVSDRAFFDLIIDLLQFETTLGPIRFGEYRREHDQLLLARTGEQFRRLDRVAAASGLRVFNGGYTYHEELLTRAVECHPHLSLRTFDSADLVETLPEPRRPERFEALLADGAPALAERGCELAVRDFEPDDIPALFALGLDAEFHRRIDRTKAMVTGMWREVLEVMAPRPKQVAPTRLCLNARSPLVRRLASIQETQLRRIGIEVLYVQALMAGQHALTADEMALLHRRMEELLTRVAGTEDGA